MRSHLTDLEESCQEKKYLNEEKMIRELEEINFLENVEFSVDFLIHNFLQGTDKLVDFCLCPYSNPDGVG